MEKSQRECRKTQYMAGDGERWTDKRKERRICEYEKETRYRRAHRQMEKV